MIKKTLMTLSALVMLTLAAQAEPWMVDHAHSEIGFQVRHMMVSKVHGAFQEYEGTVDFDGQDVTKGSVEFTIQAASIDTDNENRNGHLKSPDFFDVEKYPTITFKSTKIVKGEEDKFQIVGNLTIKDVTKQVTFDCVMNGMFTDAKGMSRAGFSAETTINRQDYHVNWSKTLDNGGLVASDDVTIQIEIEIIHKPA